MLCARSWPISGRSRDSQSCIFKSRSRARFARPTCLTHWRRAGFRRTSRRTIAPMTVGTTKRMVLGQSLVMATWITVLAAGYLIDRALMTLIDGAFLVWVSTWPPSGRVLSLASKHSAGSARERMLGPPDRLPAKPHPRFSRTSLPRWARSRRYQRMPGGGCASGTILRCDDLGFT
jgi:hypothetical protein